MLSKHNQNKTVLRCCDADLVLNICFSDVKTLNLYWIWKLLCVPLVSQNCFLKCTTLVSDLCCFIQILLASMSSFWGVLVLRLEVKNMNLVLPSPKWILSLLSTNQSHMFVKSLFKLLFNILNIPTLEN